MNNKEVFIQLARLGIGHYAEGIPADCNWQEIKALAEKHRLSAIILDGLNNCYADLLPVTMKLKWIGDVLQNYEARYADYRKCIGELATFCNRHGFKLMVLKGYGLSLYWPNPNHRPCGDIDIYVFGEYKAVDAALQKELGIIVENGHHHHTVFGWKGYSVENHYDFVNIHYGHGNGELELVFKELSKDDTHYVEIDGERLYIPSPNLHALFLLRHCMQDFASAVLNLRQVLDWAFLIQSITKKIDWTWFVEIIKRYKMLDFFNCLNAICVDNLGFDVKIFPFVQFNPFVKEKVLNEILEPSFVRDEPNIMIPRLIYKYRRWKGNSWKQELCYHDNRVISFFIGVWNHLLKPKTI